MSKRNSFEIYAWWGWVWYFSTCWKQKPDGERFQNVHQSTAAWRWIENNHVDSARERKAMLTVPLRPLNFHKRMYLLGAATSYIILASPKISVGCGPTSAYSESFNVFACDK